MSEVSWWTLSYVDVVFATAHKAKGLEFDTVQLGNDFLKGKSEEGMFWRHMQMKNNCICKQLILRSMSIHWCILFIPRNRQSWGRWSKCSICCCNKSKEEPDLVERFGIVPSQKTEGLYVVFVTRIRITKVYLNMSASYIYGKKSKAYGVQQQLNLLQGLGGLLRPQLIAIHSKMHYSSNKEFCLPWFISYNLRVPSHETMSVGKIISKAIDGENKFQLNTRSTYGMPFVSKFLQWMAL